MFILYSVGEARVTKEINRSIDSSDNYSLLSDYSANFLWHLKVSNQIGRKLKGKSKYGKLNKCNQQNKKRKVKSTKNSQLNFQFV